MMETSSIFSVPQRKARVSAEEWLMAVESAEAQHFGPVTDGDGSTR